MAENNTYDCCLCGVNADAEETGEHQARTKVVRPEDSISTEDINIRVSFFAM